MYTSQQQQQKQAQQSVEAQANNNNNNITNNNNNKITKEVTSENLSDCFAPHLTSAYSTCSIIKLQATAPSSTVNCYSNPADSTHMTLLSLRRRRWLLQRHACLLSILLAFIFGLALGVFMPMFGWANVLQTLTYAPPDGSAQSMLPLPLPLPLAVNNLSTATTLSTHMANFIVNRTKVIKARPPSDFPTIYESRNALTADNAFSVAFIKEAKTSQEKSYGKAALPHKQQASSKGLPSSQQQGSGIIKANIFWGEEVERALPSGFTAADTQSWNQYVSTRGVVQRLEPGCGRMQNRLVIYVDGTRACARYRQNTDQIQGELFSFYLGQLLNLSNLAPSAAAVIDFNAHTWHDALTDLTQAQWKQQRPVVLTRWLPELEPAGIPQPFQPMERHLNKYDVWNITQMKQSNELSDKPEKGLLKRLETAKSKTLDHQSITTVTTVAAAAVNSQLVMQRLIELAQWSDLIVFDYLIANLDRVVNNLYNFQWNADIMAAPAHNLARQTHSQLLVFLDNESGLLHGYRLLKKYEAYHGLLLDNLCVFRQPTIEALQELREQGVGRRLRELFENTTTSQVRDVLPSLPDKSIKILVDRIDRVLGQVQKCRDLLADR